MTLSWEPPGPGPWQQDRAHSPQAVTPLLAELYPKGFKRGFEEAFARYGAILDSMVMKVVNGYNFMQIQPFDMPGPDGPPSPEHLGAEIGRRTGVAAAALGERIWLGDMDRWDNELKPAAIRRHRELYAVDLGALSSEELTRHIDSVKAHLADMVFQHHRFNLSALLPVGRFMLAAAPMVHRPPDSLFALFDGYSNVSGPLPEEMVPAVEALKDNAEARAVLEGGQPAEERLAQVAATVPEVADYVAAVGYRIVDGFDILNPTLGESPDLLLGKLAAGLTVEPGEARARSDEAADSLRSGLDSDQQAAWDALLADARHVYRLRDERGIYSDVSAIGLLRLAVMEVGRRAQAQGRLSRIELALEATEGEISDVVAGAGPTSAELEARVEARTGSDIRDVPRFLGPPPPEPPPVDQLPPPLAEVMSSVGFIIEGVLGELDEPVGDDRVIGGISANQGVYEGPARHVSSVEQLFDIEPGDVLVAPTTGEAFNAILHLIGAVVTDHGSFACHAGIVAREMGFPAVVGTVDGSRRIPMGAMVRVDGDSGEVTVLS